MLNNTKWRFSPAVLVFGSLAVGVAAMALYVNISSTPFPLSGASTQEPETGALQLVAFPAFAERAEGTAHAAAKSSISEAPLVQSNASVQGASAASLTQPTAVEIAPETRTFTPAQLADAEQVEQRRAEVRAADMSRLATLAATFRDTPIVMHPLEQVLPNLTPLQRATVAEMRDDFVKEVEGSGSKPNDAQLPERWHRARVKGDEEFRARMGNAAADRAELAAAQAAYEAAMKAP